MPGSTTRKNKLNALTQVQDLIDQILYTAQILKEEKDLSPKNPLITETLSSFVQNITHAQKSMSEDNKTSILESPVVNALYPTLLEGLSKAEYEMELYFSNLFLEKDTLDDNNLEEFWYLQNYKDLIDIELEQISLTDNAKDIVFIGSGPLPLSAIIMQQKTNRNIICIDQDSSAVNRGERLVEKLGLSDKIQFKHLPGHLYDFKKAGTVLIASLVQDKGIIIPQILKTSTKPPQIAMRSAQGLNTLLYSPVKKSILKEFNVVAKFETRPTPKVINSTVFCVIK